MQKNKLKLFFIIVVILVVAGVAITRMKRKKSSDEIVKDVALTFGSIQTIVSTTGTILPQNRLELKPPVNGRIESILVKEGDKVKTGQIVAWMGSTERAALLDAARGQSQEQLKYWQDVYKPIPLFSPIDAEVIVATIQPGQTIMTADAVIVLSDHLIVRAQVDETDIGKIKLGQKANITLDAYADKKIAAIVAHIYYESQTVNNVTIYNVDLLPVEVPLFFRSGMNATVDFITQSKQDVLILPQEAVHKEKEENFVFLKQANGKEPLKVGVTLGISDEKNVEVTSGVNEKDIIILNTKKYVLPTSDTGSNPFMPFRRRK